MLSNERKLYKILCHFIDTFDNPESTKTQVCHELENAGHGLRGCRPRKKPQVQNPHFQPVLKFAVAYLDRQNAFWRRVLWSDETEIELFGHNGKNKGEAFKP